MHRWLQFRLRFLALVVTVIAACLGGWRVYVFPMQRRAAAVETIRDCGGVVHTDGDAAWPLDSTPMLRRQGAVVFLDLRGIPRTKQPSVLAGLRSLESCETMVVDDGLLSAADLQNLIRGRFGENLVLDSTTSFDGIASSDGVSIFRTELTARRRIEEAGGRMTCHEAAPLDVQRDRITKWLGADAFSRVKKVSFSSTARDSDLRSLDGLSQLSELCVYDGNITDEGVQALAQHRQLKHLNLHNTKVTDQSLETICQLTELESLGLTGGRITDTNLHLLHQLPRLQALGLAGTDITGEGFADPGPRSRLKELYAEETSVSDEGLAAVARFEQLQILNLRDVPITDVGVKQLTVLKHLKRLTLDGTCVSDPATAEIRRILPSCGVSNSSWVWHLGDYAGGADGILKPVDPESWSRALGGEWGAGYPGLYDSWQEEIGEP